MYEGKYSSNPIKDVTGFGFSYVFTRKVWELFPFPDKEHGEDQGFIDHALTRFELYGIQDQNFRSCIHVEQGGNISFGHPQLVAPASILTNLFPAFSAQAYVDASMSALANWSGYQGG